MRRRVWPKVAPNGGSMDIAEDIGEVGRTGGLPGVIAAAATDKGVIFEGAAGGLGPTA